MDPRRPEPIDLGMIRPDKAQNFRSWLGAWILITNQLQRTEHGGLGQVKLATQATLVRPVAQ